MNPLAIKAPAAGLAAKAAYLSGFSRKAGVAGAFHSAGIHARVSRRPHNRKMPNADAALTTARMLA